MLEENCFSTGKIIYNELKDINARKLISDQTDLLKEDLFQVQYEEWVIVDVGWYPSFSVEGHFRTVVIQNCDWETPIFEKTCTDLELLQQHLLEALDIASKLVQQNTSNP
ncbi:hypothetical protein B5M42_004970 [Paenibacillus athensensis]|uniref:Uncharacterized protein n=1 Tax=Paenibacillus athensensis TaxID=1967502 RepID=A0A4Y8PV35_9BACL|nr:hypothetical protein [Paenibacillus athensensis]MCD1258190.1 hypothetical protein [Paenibacillus athensensis]